MNETKQDTSQIEISPSAITDEFLQKYVPIEIMVAMTSIPEEKLLGMIAEGTCEGYKKNKQWFVARKELEKFNENISSSTTRLSSANNFQRFVRGEFGLPATFWLFGVFTTMVLIFLLVAIFQLNEDLIMPLFSIFVAYQYLVLIAVVRSCKYYQGSQARSALAVITHLAFVLLVSFVWLYIFSIEINGYASN